MNGSIFVRPVSGRNKVRDPCTMQHLRDEGQLVTVDDAYWYRRQADGDVDIFDDAPVPAEMNAPKETQQ